MFRHKSITFPTKFDSIEKKEVKIFYARESNIVWQIMVSKKADYDSTQYSKDYDAFLKGYFSSDGIKPFSHEVKDSVIGGVNGKFIHGYRFDKPTQFFTFITFLHGRAYIIQITFFTSLTEQLKESINTFLNKVSFSIEAK